jgi:hypothetical protein
MSALTSALWAQISWWMCVRSVGSLFTLLLIQCHTNSIERQPSHGRRQQFMLSSSLPQVSDSTPRQPHRAYYQRLVTDQKVLSDVDNFCAAIPLSLPCYAFSGMRSGEPIQVDDVLLAPISTQQTHSGTVKLDWCLVICCLRARTAPPAPQLQP